MADFKLRSKVLDQEGIEKSLTRIAHEILERNKENLDGLVIVGIMTRGATLAERIYQLIQQLSGKTLPVGVMDITLYRDDLTQIAQSPIVHETRIDFDITDKKIILVDDVLFTGRTVRCAMDELVDFGRPKAIQLAVLVDRGHRELPIRPDYVGKNLPTNLNEIVHVKLRETDGSEEVVIEEKT